MGDGKAKNGKKHHKRSRSKKPSGLCCSSKKSKTTRHRKDKKHAKKHKSSKIHHEGVGDTRPETGDENLGRIVLVKDAGKKQDPPSTLQVAKTQQQQSAEKDKEKSEKIMPEPTSNKRDSKSGEKNIDGKLKLSEEKDTTDKKECKEDDVAGSMKKLSEKPPQVRKKSESTSDTTTTDDEHKVLATAEKKEKWKLFGRMIESEDAEWAIKEFDKTGGYVPTLISRINFLNNMDKNRYSDIICMDHSRVVLNDGSYVHANWVFIGKGKRSIATQLPLPNTAGTFWKMVLEQRVKSILLSLTDEEYEKNGAKLVFPENQDFMYFETHDLRVGEFRRISVQKNWQLRVISVSDGKSKSFVHLHHYTSWPHGGVPSNFIDLWKIQATFRKYASPSVYMSLAGSGRAGTYALFERAHANLHDDERLDVEECLRTVREGRLHACQTVEQYALVYALLAEHVLNVSKGNDQMDEKTAKMVEKVLM